MKKEKGVFFGIVLLILSGCAPSNENSIKENEWIHNGKTEYTAHRGAHTIAPENTVLATEEAAKHGYTAVEMDVRETKDKHFVLMHDDNINVTTTGSGNVEEMTLAQVEKVNLKTENYPKLSNKTIKIPTFEQEIKAIAKTDMGVNMDGSKGNWNEDYYVDSVVNTLKKYDVYDRTFFVLSDKPTRDKFMKKHPEAIVTWLHSPATKVSDEIEELQKYPNAIFSVRADQVTNSMLVLMKSFDIPVHIYGVNTQTNYDFYKSMNVRFLETDTVVPA